MFKVRYRYLFILILSVYSFLNLKFTVGDKLFDFEVTNLVLISTLSINVLLIWELNRLIELKLPKLTALTAHKVHPLIILFVLSLANVAISGFMIMEVIYPLMGMPLQINFSHLALLVAFGFRVNLFLNCVNAIVFFNTRLKKSELAAAEFKRESMEAKYQALRSQVNPHFLFNSFNTLSSLVHKNADTSAEFIEQLSEVYRYVLNNQETKVVSLAEELRFIEAYSYLLKMRFGDNLEINTQVDRDEEKTFVAPVVLQLLIENAIKHNVVSRKHKLKIDLFSQNGSIVVRNNLHEKMVRDQSHGIGLKNIQGRYQFLSDEPVSIEKTSDYFTVKLPLVHLSL